MKVLYKKSKFQRFVFSLKDLFEITDYIYPIEEKIHNKIEFQFSKQIQSTFSSSFCRHSLHFSPHFYPLFYILSTSQILLFFYLIYNHISSMLSHFFEENVQDDIEIPLTIRGFSQSIKPCHFMELLNEKSLGKIPEQNIKIAKQMVRSYGKEILAINAIRNNQYTKNKLVFLVSQSTAVCAKRVRERRAATRINPIKLTIQKKHSTGNPLNGQGVVKMKTGEVVFGTWQEGAIIGDVNIIYPSGGVYQGGVKEGAKHGMGTYVLKDGSKYMGEFIAGKYDGVGQLRNEFGDVVKKGVWKNGKIVLVC